MWMPPPVRRLWRWLYARTGRLRGQSLLPPPRGELSYSQFGEDIVFEYAFHAKAITNPTYLDVGAYKPVELSNTYRLYSKGSRGVLVEPNADLCAELRAARPRDVVLNCAVRTKDMPPQVDYYMLAGGSLNTIVRREAEHAVESRAWGPQQVKEVRSVPALTINEILERHFPNGVDLIDIDVEGLDFEILQEIDFDRFKPQVVSVEIHGGHHAQKLADGSYTHIPAEAFVAFMKTKGYRLFIHIILNGIFVRE
jgi:FkbM family methyltransferase